MSLPNEGTEEFIKETEFYKHALTEDLKKRAKQLGMQYDSYTQAMRRRGIYQKSSTEANPLPEIKIPEVIIKELPEIKIKPLKAEHRDTLEGEEVQVALISDAHGGIQTPTYNQKVFKQRLQIYSDTITKFARLHRKMRPIKKLVIPMLGDIVQGQQIGVQMMAEECEIVGAENQIYDLLLPEFTSFAVNLLQVFEEIEIYGVAGNHGNINRRRDTITKRSNWDSVFYRALKAALVQYKRIKVDPETETWYKIIEINNWKFFMTHLDNILSYQGIPFYGLSRKGLRWKQSITENFDFIIGGHFHNPNFLYNDGVPVILNGTFMSDSDFPLVRMGLKDVPEQTCFFVNKKYGITAYYRVQLDKKK